MQGELFPLVTEFSSHRGDIWMVTDGDELQVLTDMRGGGSHGVPYPTSWTFCHVGDFLLILQERLWRVDLSDAGVRMQQGWRPWVLSRPM